MKGVSKRPAGRCRLNSTARALTNQKLRRFGDTTNLGLRIRRYRSRAQSSRTTIAIVAAVMRILYVGNIQSVHLRRWVSAAVAAGDETAVCSFADGECEVDVEVMRTYGLGKAAFFLCMPQLNRIVRDMQPDIVHAHYLTSLGVCGPRRRATDGGHGMGSDLLRSNDGRRASGAGPMQFKGQTALPSSRIT